MNEWRSNLIANISKYVIIFESVRQWIQRSKTTRRGGDKDMNYSQRAYVQQILKHLQRRIAEVNIMRQSLDLCMDTTSQPKCVGKGACVCVFVFVFVCVCLC